METTDDWVTTYVRAVRRYGADSLEVGRLVDETSGIRAAFSQGVAEACDYVRNNYGHENVTAVRVHKVITEGGDLGTSYGAHCIAYVEIQRKTARDYRGIVTGEPAWRWVSGFGITRLGHAELWCD